MVSTFQIKHCFYKIYLPFLQFQILYQYIFLNQILYFLIRYMVRNFSYYFP